MTERRAAVRALARTVLYEGYVLYPYGATSLKNRGRVSFGELAAGARSYAELPVASCAESADLELAFLQPVERTVYDAEDRAVERIDVGERRLVSFCECREVREEVTIDLRALGDGVTIVARAAELSEDTRVMADGATARVCRRAAALECAVKVSWRPSNDTTGTGFRILRVEIKNQTRGEGAALAVHSPHVLLSATEATFASVIDPPAALSELAAECESDGLWPVLAGPPGDRAIALLAPIILYDHPALAPESTGDLFDATENDELLTFSILALTDDERRTMAATDPRSAEILARVDALGERIAALHGVARSPVVGGGLGSARAARVGDRVVLRPLGRDVHDASLDGKSGRVVETVAEVTGREHLVIVIDDDPGKDLGEAGLGLGHRFFVSRDEVEILASAEVE